MRRIVVGLLLGAFVIGSAISVGGRPAAAAGPYNVRASVANNGSELADISYAPAISANGRYVAFVSAATGLTPLPVNGSSDVYVRDLQNGTTTLVSVNASGTAGGNGDSGEPEITPDGRYITFSSDAEDLVNNDSNGVQDVFVRDMQTNTTELVSLAADGTQSMDYSYAP